MNEVKTQTVLISGASIAGLTTAWWLNHIGYQVTVIELAASPRTVGGAVDFVGDSVAIAKRMGLYEQLRSQRLGVDRIEFKNAADTTEGTMVLNNRPDSQEATGEEIEIERDKFVAVMLTALNNDVEFIYNDRVSSLLEEEKGMIVTFGKSVSRSFDLVIGCDGSHSGIRKLFFGPEKDYSNFLGAYFSISIVPELLVPQRTMQLYRVPYQSVMLNAYNNKTDIVFTFVSDTEIPYDYRDIEQQKQIIANQFAGQGWRSEDLLDRLAHNENFYFDKFCQIQMPAWSKGRVALVGDAAYCASAAAGQGASLSMIGAAALADALIKHPDNFSEAFFAYEKSIRPHVEEIQAMARENVVEHLILKTEEEIRIRNEEARLF